MDSKRNKPGLAKSLLQKVPTRPDDGQDNASGVAIDTSPLLTSPSNQAGLGHSPSARDLTLASSSNVSTASMSNLDAMPGGAGQPSSSAPKGSSIESSVRLFRLYEALRSGDTAALNRAIKEGSAARPEASRRQSSSSFASLGGNTSGVEGTTILHLAIQCAEIPVVEYVISTASPTIDVNSRDREGNTPLHLASMLSRAPVVRLLLEQKDINDALTNYQGKTALDLARSPEIFEQLQLFRSVFVDAHVKELQSVTAKGDYDRLQEMLVDPHIQSTIDINGAELATDPDTNVSGGTLLHEAARRRDIKLIQILLLNGADPFRRDRKGKLPQDVTKDDRTRAILKRSPAAAAAQRGIQEKTILGSAAASGSAGVLPGESALNNKDGREFKGYLKKWTNYTSGYKLRWFVLEDGVLSYYKHQDDAGSACRGAINMRIARLHMDAQDKLRFEIHGKSSVKYHLKANHQVEAKRWYWALNNAIQWAKDEAKEEAKKQARDTETRRHAKLGQVEKLQTRDLKEGNGSQRTSPSTYKSAGAFGISANTSQAGGSTGDADDIGSAYEPSLTDRGDVSRVQSHVASTTAVGDQGDEEEFDDDASSTETKPTNKDAFMIAAQSARVQLDLLSNISSALNYEKSKNPSLTLSDPTIAQALTSYEGAISNLKGLVGDLGRITRDREAYWQYRVEHEINIRKVWEENMTRIALEQEELENKIGESEDKRKRTKKALKDALEGNLTPLGAPPVRKTVTLDPSAIETKERPAGRKDSAFSPRRKSTIEQFTNLSDSESEGDDDEEFFDAVDAGAVTVVEELPTSIKSPPIPAQPVVDSSTDIRDIKASALQLSYKGYEDPVREKLAMDADNRPKISLWGILKSMIGKDMTKMTLPVSFNEPTSLLQRVAEDMEYTDLLDTASERADSTERMVYVAAFAASEYASTIGRVAKPFNPLLGETYEYVRPDKGYRFLIEQVSHHPPIGAAWAESKNWDYYGESAVKSKFYGKSFDINPLGTWFLRLRPTSSPAGYEELYTWKKVTSSVVGIITGNPTVDNYGPMEIKNWATGDTCLLDFKQRGWKASSAYQVSGKVVTRDGQTAWSIGGRWNDKIYARHQPSSSDAAGADAPVFSPISPTSGDSAAQAILIWAAHPKPAKPMPFNLTPYVITLNALPAALRARLPPTDTRLRPDQRAMEDGAYDFAATEKNRVEEKQRAARRAREQAGTEFVPHWFRKDVCAVSGEEFWRAIPAEGSKTEDLRYWAARDAGKWDGCEDIF